MVASDVEKTETERRRSAEIGALPETNMPSYEQKNGVPPADMNYE